MNATLCPRCGTPLPEGAQACASCGWTTSPGGMTRVATADEHAALAAGPRGPDPLLEALRKDLAAEYDVEGELGRGGMAVVYKAVERELHRPVALKVLPPGFGGPEMAERFRREARMAAALDHPSIIPVYRVGQAAGTYFFAMKFVEGRAVDAIVESQGPLPIPVIVQILRAAAAALAFAHERGIVHRDIKGANILVDRDGRVMVSDLGIARARESKELTASGSVMGTPHFMSPEQCAGQRASPQSDQYSLGILAFQMLTGSVPFDADSLMGILQHHFFTPVPDIAGVRAGVPEQVITLVRRALAKAPEDRYPTTREMLAQIERVPLSEGERQAADDMLRKLALGETLPLVRTGSLPPLPDARTAAALSSQATMPAPTVRVQPDERGKRPAPRRRSRAPLIVAGAVVLAAAGAGLVWQWNRSAVQQLQQRAVADSAARAESLRISRRDSASLAAAAAAHDSALQGEGVAVSSESAAGSAALSPASGRRTAARPRTPPPRPAPASGATEAAAPAVGSTTLSLRTIPTNADVTLDGRPLPQGGVIGFQIAAGRHILVVHAGGCQDLRTTIDAQDGVPVNLHTITLTCQ